MKFSRKIPIMKRKGVAQAIGVFILIVILTGALYIPLNYAVLNYEATQQSLWSNNIFDADTLTFVEQFWVWFPAIVFFTGIGYVYMKAQKRTE